MVKVLFFTLMAIAVGGCGIEIVDTGNRGIKVRMGEVMGEPLPEGLYFHTPFIETIKELSIRENKFADKTLCYSKDAQVIDVSYTINFRPVASEIHNIFKEVGSNWREKLLTQILEGNIKEIAGKYRAVDLIEKRQEATTQITEKLKEELALKRIELMSFEINNMDFDDQFENAVKKKVIAVEEAKEAVNKTVRVKEEAQQRIIAAKAEAESMTIRSRALSQNKGLVEYEAVQKWDGVLPKQMFGNAIPFINIQSK